MQSPDHQRRVLIIDDDIILCNVFKDILEHNGFRTFIAQKEEDVLAIVSRESVDLVYIDLEMPDLNSVDISNQIKKINPNTMVVLISGYSRQIVEEEMNLKIGKGIIDKFLDKGDLYNLPSVTEKLLSE